MKATVEIPDELKNSLEIQPVASMDEVLKKALVHMPEPIEWDEEAEAAKAASVAGDEEAPAGVTAH